ncbi:response regulator transcription factor [uncultured Sphingomonas sp.]|uniref:response regulator transcription factor n=1 Tax=uncultured Sphingomonas sp. TaxID=158754 RepID=UPI0025F05A82|nr:response regulator transcription factor [uncultured Sphingomonas sp.]
MNILIVEDDAELAASLAADLTTMNYTVTTAVTGREALVETARQVFDAVLLDCMLPEMDGVSVVRALRERGQMLPVLMLSALGRSVEKVEGLEAGADDYVVKPTPASEIDARLKALVRARSWTAGEGDTLTAGPIVVSPVQHRAWYDGQSVDLTQFEFKLLLELVRHRGGYVGRQLLLERVWGYDFEPATNIVEGLVRSLRRKLVGDGRADPIITKRGVGYSLRC